MYPTLYVHNISTTKCDEETKNIYQYKKLCENDKIQILQKILLFFQNLYKIQIVNIPCGMCVQQLIGGTPGCGRSNSGSNPGIRPNIVHTVKYGVRDPKNKKSIKNIYIYIYQGVLGRVADAFFFRLKVQYSPVYIQSV